MTASGPLYRSRWAGRQPTPSMSQEDVAAICATIWPDREAAWAAAVEVADGGWWVQQVPDNDPHSRVATVRFPAHGGPLGDVRFRIAE